MSFVLRNKTQIATFVSAVVLSVLLVALQVFGASLVDTDSVGVGTTTVGAGLHVTEGFTSVLDGDAYIYGQLNAAYLVATSTTDSSFAGNVGLGSTTPGGALGVQGAAFVDDFLSVSTVLATSSIGVGTNTPGMALGVNGAALIEDFVSVSTLLATSSAGVGTGTPAGALGVDGAAFVNGFIFADQITASSTNPSGVGTDTPGTVWAVGGTSDMEWLTVEDHIRTSFLLSTSTTATSTLSRFGSELASTTIVIDGASGRMAIGTSVVADADVVAGTFAVDPVLTLSGQGSAQGATGTLYISGEGATGGQIIIKDSSGLGSRCVSLIVNTGATDVGGSGAGVAELLIAKVVACPR